MSFKYLLLLMVLNSSFSFCQIIDDVEILRTKWKRTKYPASFIGDSTKQKEITGSEIIYIDTLNYSFQIDTLKGKFDKKIKIWNPEKKLILKGHYNENQKSGIWRYYDKSGKLINKRKYFNSYQFKSLKSNQKIFVIDSLNKNNENYIEYPFVADSCNFSWSRYYKYIPNNFNNKLLFKNNLLWKTIKNQIKLNPKNKIYKTSDFYKEYNNDEITSILKSHSNNIIGYKISEVYYFDKCRSITESRIMGICPVGISENGTKEDLFWIFYPQLRSELAKTTFKTNNHIKTLEDIFHFQNFSSIIYHQESAEKNQYLLIKEYPELNILNSIKLEIKRIINIEYQSLQQLEFSENN
ncbi:hypothetical protein [Kordia jejudonensis]|uniref:hypothetical protein n=1 Tax=Kordia jejudonensis TaxID=1348245 RepID=UPI000629AD03|nr:hypothetical protein [Kordia jejudonensis]